MESDKKDRITAPNKNIFQSGFTKIQTNIMETMGLGKTATISALILIALVTVLIIFLFVHSAPPKTIIMTSGDDDSMFYNIAGNMPRYWLAMASNLKLSSLKDRWKIWKDYPILPIALMWALCRRD